MTHKSLLTISLLLLTILSGCALSSCTYKKGSKTKSQQEVHFSDFTAINANRGVDLEITQGAEYAVSVIAPEKYMDDVKIEQQGETLYITLEKDHASLINIDKDITVRISMPHITQVDLSGGTEAHFIGAFEAPTFSAHLSGASEVENLSISAEEVRIEAYGASDFSGSVRATRSTIDLSGASDLSIVAQQIGQLTMQLSGSSDAEIDGSITNLTASLSGSSEIDGESLSVSDLDLSMSGASSVEIRNSGSLRYSIDGASKLVVYGSPKVLDSKSDRSSSVQML